MELLLIRHALPVRREVSEGPADPALSEAGAAQADHLAAYLATEPIDAVYTSPLRRAIETAAPLGRAHRLQPIEAPDVAEWDRHATEYVPVEELKANDDPRWRALLQGEWDADEERDGFRARVVAAVEGIVGGHRGQHVAVVCHGGVINTYLAHVLGIDDDVGFFYPNYTSIHRVAAAGSGERSIVTINETSHLRGTGLPMGLFQDGGR